MSGTQPRKARIRDVLRDAWHLTAPFFRSEQRWMARGLLAAVIVLNLSQVAFDVLLNFWRGAMYDTLQQKDLHGFLDLVLLWRANDDGFMPGFVIIVAVLIPIAVYAVYLNQVLQIRWRAWMTDHVLGDWMSDRAFYTMALQQVPGLGTPSLATDGARGTDNPDQRISEDLDNFTSTTLSFGIDLLSTVVSLASFAQILWSLSGMMTLFGVNVPGYLLYLALAYALVGTLATHWIGRPLARLEFIRQRVEADFRFGLVRVRENAEGIALYAGEAAERAGLTGRFGAIMANWYALISRRKKLSTLRLVYAQAAVIYPFVIASPRYFSGAIQLGGMMRIVGAFAQVQTSLSWFVDNYAALAAWRATVDRLASFQRALVQARALSGGGVRAEAGAPGAVSLHDVTLALPDGRTLLRNSTASLPAGQALLLVGRSGTGKSTLFRALAGIWPFGTGTVSRPPGAAPMFLPQRAYTPLGTLRRAVTYPAAADSVPDAAIREALADVGLGALVAELDHDQPWGQRLSGGEQQRLAVARALLTRPDWLFLDEATASLDPAAEAELYATIRRRLPGTTVVSIAHRPEVARWHDRMVTLENGALVADPMPAAAK